MHLTWDQRLRASKSAFVEDKSACGSLTLSQTPNRQSPTLSTSFCMISSISAAPSPHLPLKVGF